MNDDVGSWKLLPYPKRYAIIYLNTKTAIMAFYYYNLNGFRGKATGIEISSSNYYVKLYTESNYKGEHIRVNDDYTNLIDLYWGGSVRSL